MARAHGAGHFHMIMCCFLLTLSLALQGMELGWVLRSAVSGFAHLSMTGHRECFCLYTKQVTSSQSAKFHCCTPHAHRNIDNKPSNRRPIYRSAASFVILRGCDRIVGEVASDRRATPRGGCFWNWQTRHLPPAEGHSKTTAFPQKPEASKETIRHELWASSGGISSAWAEE